MFAVSSKSLRYSAITECPAWQGRQDTGVKCCNTMSYIKRVNARCSSLSKILSAERKIIIFDFASGLLEAIFV